MSNLSDTTVKPTISPEAARGTTTNLVWFLRACADAVERGDLDTYDVIQALFQADDYTITCPISEAAATGRPKERERGDMLDALLAMAGKLAAKTSPVEPREGER